jgi:hypothetical protein
MVAINKLYNIKFENKKKSIEKKVWRRKRNGSLTQIKRRNEKKKQKKGKEFLFLLRLF